MTSQTVQNALVRLVKKPEVAEPSVSLGKRPALHLALGVGLVSILLVLQLYFFVNFVTSPRRKTAFVPASRRCVYSISRGRFFFHASRFAFISGSFSIFVPIVSRSDFSQPSGTVMWAASTAPSFTFETTTQYLSFT